MRSGPLPWLRRALVAGALIGAAALSALPAQAHHSAVIYDRARPIVLKGVVKDLMWENPHGWFEMLVVSDGAKPMAWIVEMEGITVMRREGWSPNSLAPGDRVTVRVMPLKDGRPGARLIDLTKSDGTVLHLFTPRPSGV